jgi:hypothetical protein
MLVAGLRSNSRCPCHRCLIPKNDLGKLGAPTDTERYDQMQNEGDQRKLVDEAKTEIAAGFTVNSTRIDYHLKETSLHPVHVSQSETPFHRNFGCLT